MRDFVPLRISFRVILERSEESRLLLCVVPTAAAALRYLARSLYGRGGRTHRGREGEGSAITAHKLRSLADAEVAKDCVEDVFAAYFAGDRAERGRCGHYVDRYYLRRHHRK